MTKVFNFNKGIYELARGVLMLKSEEKVLREKKLIRDNLEDIADRYSLRYSEVYDAFLYERTKIFVRDYSLLKLFISDKSSYNQKTFDILKRYYRKEVSKYM